MQGIKMIVKEFCENCEKIVELNLKEKSNIKNIRGKNYNYIELEGYCKECGMQISSGKLIDENLKRIDNAFRTEEKIITKSQIDEILKKYKIGKKPLAKLLGWGEVTLIRYINGDIPTKPYSDELMKILKDNEYFLELLEENKDKISKTAYISAYNSAKNDFIVTSDIELVAQYLIYKCNDITPLALQKLLYYAQGFYKIFFCNFLFKDECEAWEHGPVYRKIYDKYKGYSYNVIEQYIDYEIEDILDEEKKALLDVIVKSFGFYSGKALEKMTHYEKPWIEARKGIPANEKCNNIINKEKIEEYFEFIKEQYDMINVVDIRKYSDNFFKEVILFG